MSDIYDDYDDETAPGRSVPSSSRVLLVLARHRGGFSHWLGDSRATPIPFVLHTSGLSSHRPVKPCPCGPAFFGSTAFARHTVFPPRSPIKSIVAVSGTCGCVLLDDME
ncbi:hypothetical protein MTO96_038105 [Rhipicephalus appendiculatus]